MSLFGTSPDELPPAKQSALFDEEAAPQDKKGSSLFADDLDGSDSPWALPTPKRAARNNLVKTLLSTNEVPERYVDIYDALIEDDDDGTVTFDGVKKLLGESGVGTQAQGKILETVFPSGQEPPEGVGRGEFNVLLALVGLAQEGEDVTLDGVDERRKNLPVPRLKVRKPAKAQESTMDAASARFPDTPPMPAAKAPPVTPPSHTSGMRKTSFGLDADPWNSPEMHKSHDHSQVTPPRSNGAVKTLPVRTTSAFTTAGGDDEANGNGNQAKHIIGSNGNTGNAWGGYGGAPEGGFGGEGLGQGFGAPAGSGQGDDDPTGLGRSLGGNPVVNLGADDIITITTIPEKEGIFLFQHRNYQVNSAKRNSSVVRRYSDFVWLLDCLHKRYPFRQLPLLPPKRPAINGNYIGADAQFVERRRRGLSRFANALVRHPVLSQEQLVIMFLTVPTELAVWRKQAAISVQDEFTGRSLAPELEENLPPQLQDMFDTVRMGVRRSAEMYINLCQLMERLCKRNEGVAADYKRFGLALQSITEASNDTYAYDTNEVPLLNEGLNSTAKHLHASQSLLEDEARAWDEGVLEDLKRQRDCLVSMRDLFDRRDRLDRDNIPQLERRIKSNEAKLQGIRNKPENLIKPGEIEKVEEAIVKDKQSIVNQHARGVFIKECLRDEITFFQTSMYHVSRLHQDWSQERVKYSELQADNWRALSEEVDGMPLGD
ncbi:sorting nexin Mvp1 [Phyllosticta citricarpa]|uniref:Sorting nexin MVP1 n=2 Tax=Phyllosticta TaxID=121621 RepID=A0ABR1LYV0_9PEZI